MTFNFGQALTDTVTLVDSTNTAITGATFTTVATADPTGASFALTYVELGNGAYRFTVPASDVTAGGNYYARVQADDSQSQNFELEWEVSHGAVTTYTASVTGMTRLELRRAILGEIGDIVLTTATAQSGSSQWTDLDTLAFGDSGRFSGRELLVTGGTATNIGLIRGISGSNGAGTLQLTRALTAAVAEGDEGEIVNTYGSGVTVAAVHQAINTAIRNAKVEVEIASIIPGTFDNEVRSFAIPPEYTAINAVQFNYANDPTTQGYRSVMRGQYAGDDGWFVDKAERTIYIGGPTGYGMDGATIRILGWGIPAPITNDDDIPPVNAEWLIAEVASKLLLRPIGAPRSISPEWERKGFYLAQEADRLRDFVRVRRSPNHVRL